MPAIALPKVKYNASEIYKFFTDAELTDKLGLNDPTAARWLAPSAPFDILDADTEVSYPSVEHYLAAMKYKMATDKPELAETLFAQDGQIHQEFLGKRSTESAQGTRALLAERNHELLIAELTMVGKESSPSAFKKYRVTYKPEVWNSVKDSVLRTALQQRWERDKKLRRIVEAAKAKKLVLLYYTGQGTGSDLGGKYVVKDKTIDGENKVGRILMELAGYNTAG